MMRPALVLLLAFAGAVGATPAGAAYSCDQVRWAVKTFTAGQLEALAQLHNVTEEDRAAARACLAAKAGKPLVIGPPARVRAGVLITPHVPSARRAHAPVRRVVPVPPRKPAVPTHEAAPAPEPPPAAEPEAPTPAAMVRDGWSAADQNVEPVVTVTPPVVVPNPFIRRGHPMLESIKNIFTDLSSSSLLLLVLAIWYVARHGLPAALSAAGAVGARLASVWNAGVADVKAAVAAVESKVAVLENDAAVIKADVANLKTKAGA